MEEVVQEVGETTEEAVELVEEATTEEESSETQVETQQEEKGGVSPAVQKRIDQITRKRYEAEREAEELRRKVAEYEASQKPKVPTEKPKLEDFEYDESQYLEALADWKIDQRTREQERLNAERQQQAQQQQMAQDFESKRELVVNYGLAAHEDFEDVVLKNPNLVISQEMANVITDLEKGHEVAYYLGKNPAEAERIAKLTPLSQAVEIGRIEAGLSMKPTKKPSAAPEPIESVGSRGASPAGLEPSLPDGRANPAWVKARNEGKI